jgi:hypothetical protein
LPSALPSVCARGDLTQAIEIPRIFRSLCAGSSTAEKVNASVGGPAASGVRARIVDDRGAPIH